MFAISSPGPVPVNPWSPHIRASARIAPAAPAARRASRSHSSEPGSGLLATRQFAERTDGIPLDATGYADLMDRVRSLYAWPDLPDDLCEAMRSLLDRDEGWTRDREPVGGFGPAFARRVLPVGRRPGIGWACCRCEFEIKLALPRCPNGRGHLSP